MYRVFYYLQRLRCLLSVTYYDMLAIDEARRPVPIWGPSAGLEQYTFQRDFCNKVYDLLELLTLYAVITQNTLRYSNNNRNGEFKTKKGRCCDIGQIDRFSRIELFPLSSCQVIILIARMAFNCSTSCLMS